MKRIPFTIAMFCAASLFAQDNYKNYYWIGQYEGTMTALTSWSEDETGYDNPVTVAPDENTILNVNKENKPTQGQLSNPARLQGNTTKAFRSLISTVNTEIHVLNTMNFTGDYISRVDSDYMYDGKSVKQLRFANDNSASTFKFLNVGGDMILSTSKYHATRVSFVKGNTMQMDVAGALKFEYTGEASAGGYHAFDMRDNNSSTGSNFLANLGGLSSSGKGVFMTASKNVVADFVFQNSADGTFKGGDFKGVFADFSTSSSTVNFTMNGDGRQSVSIYKAANGASIGISGVAEKSDMQIGKVNVTKGEFILNSELAINTVSLDGGSLKLTTSEKVGTLSIGGGELVYGGTIFADKLSIGGGELVYGGTIFADTLSVSAADAVKVVFSSEDLALHDIIVVDFEHLSGDFDANSALVAFDENGNELGGEFILNGSVGEGGTLVYSVPEPCVTAALLGMIALAAAIARRRNI